MIIGYHSSISNGFKKCMENAKENNVNIIQIFLRSPRTSKCIPKKEIDLITLHDISKKLNINIVIHGNYLVNLCRPSNDFKLKLSITSVIQDLYESSIIDALGVVIHMGHNVCNISDDEAFNNYVENVKYILKNSVPTSILILETGAGQGHEIATKLSELNRIRESLSINEKKRVKFCIDTCHLFSSGYNLNNKLLDNDINNVLGWDNVCLVHLNDSKSDFNKRKDRHADIGKGYIKMKGLRKMIELCIKYKIPMILETPEDIYNGKKFTFLHQIKFINKNLI